MADIYVKIADTRWVDYNIGGYNVLAPHFLAEKHARASWEYERFHSMEANLKAGDILMDVGAEQGQMSAIYARFVGGGQNMVLMEPTPQCWPNIKATWGANGLVPPLATWCGFVGDTTHIAEFHDFPPGYRDGWPECSYGEYLLDATKFRYLTEQAHATDTTTIDDFVQAHGIRLTAITMDIEGFEILALRGAVETLKTAKPLCWVSLHTGGNDILTQNTPGDHVQEVHDLMKELGYSGQHLSTDHEEHWLYRP